MLPKRVIHADWSVSPRKRWTTEAVLDPDGQYVAYAPRPVRDVALLALTLFSGKATLVGFDFPIGLPLAYARKAGIERFLDALPLFGEGGWPDFYSVAARADEISLRRPFYPARSGEKRRAQLTDALGIPDLHRVCDREANAAELFWTMGAKQVGKAAISGWQEILAPALRMSEYVKFAVWPFSGGFYDLLQPGWAVVCEAYPGEFYRHLGVRFPRSASKRRQADRAAHAQTLVTFADRAGIRIDLPLLDAICDGFGADASGEDRFDAVIGLFGMLNVLLERRPPGDPLSREIAEVEGWILGLEASGR